MHEFNTFLKVNFFKWSHHNWTRIWETSCNSFMRKNHCPVNNQFIFNLDIFSSHSKSVDSDPFPNSIAPSNNTSFDKRKALKSGVAHYGWIIDFTSWPDFAICTNDNIWSEYWTLINLSRWVNHNFSDDILSFGKSLISSFY